MVRQKGHGFVIQTTNLGRGEKNPPLPLNIMVVVWLFVLCNVFSVFPCTCRGGSRLFYRAMIPSLRKGIVLRVASLLVFSSLLPLARLPRMRHAHPVSVYCAVLFLYTGLIPVVAHAKWNVAQLVATRCYAIRSFADDAGRKGSDSKPGAFMRKQAAQGRGGNEGGSSMDRRGPREGGAARAGGSADADTKPVISTRSADDDEMERKYPLQNLDLSVVGWQKTVSEDMHEVLANPNSLFDYRPNNKQGKKLKMQQLNLVKDPLEVLQKQTADEYKKRKPP